ncbi:MAG: ABC transporter substrate-binding protein [Longimicrobiaceae bacterium]
MSRTASRFGVAFSLLAIAGCDRAGSSGEGGGRFDDVPEQERYGGTAVVGAIGDIPDINPLTSTDHTANQVEQYVLFTPLITYDENFEPVPRFARSWELNDDTTAITFHLLDGLYWHDGVKTTAYDVKFTYDRARDPDTGFANTAFWTNYGEATVIDSFTIRIEMEPHAGFMDPWRSLTFVPEHVLGEVPAAELRTHPFSTTEPLGNGPFEFVSRRVGQEWVFEANENFPEELGGRPYLDRIVYRSIPEPTTLLTELLTGRIDYYIAPSPEQAARIEEASGVRLLSFPDRAYVLIGWNQRLPMFEDARVRRALTMAIDREEIIEGVLYGYGDVGNSTVPPIFWQYQDSGDELAHDPARASELLAEAGWRDRDGDGILENEDGDEFRFEIMTNEGNQQRADIVEVVQADLSQIGIDAEPRISEWGAMLDRINDPERRDFEALLIGWVTEFRLDDTDLFHCDKLDDPYQWVSHCDPELDRLLDTLPTIVSREQARPLWHRYQRMVAEQQPYTIVYFQQRLEGVNNRLRGVDPDARGDWLNAQDWWLVPEGRRGE